MLRLLGYRDSRPWSAHRSRVIPTGTPCGARHILTDITNSLKVGARDLSPSRTRPQGLALAGSESETRKVQALRHIRRTAAMPWECGPSLPVSECLSDSPLCE